MKGVRLHVEGNYALFTRPESKAERISYDVPTPSAARGILEAIHWKPAIMWVIDRIHVLNPIIFDSIRRNEVSQKGPTASTVRGAARNGAPLALFVEETRQQRASLVLRDVAYVIEAHFVLTEKAGPDDNEGKHSDIFRRRARNGECFQQPCLGCREFPAFFSLLEEDAAVPVSALANDAPRDLGLMLYDMDFANGMRPMFYRPRLEKGIIDVARCKEASLCRHI
ncbi:type I-C CRISPR-associated protein Cas5c [uncultured Desulfovibrio sp.]|uniref:type I-C CRISPR-associated protein Cas5c n=1 Tax=uncultured Desulfovibrio sp. TaxID=167968 RepID=UPI00280536D0|nr:type I-C CRISPR-associated protein Cas5c [uncultured Desulfovibrio sp.]